MPFELQVISLIHRDNKLAKVQQIIQHGENLDKIMHYAPKHMQSYELHLIPPEEICRHHNSAQVQNDRLRWVIY